MLANLLSPKTRSSSTADLDGDGTNLSEVSDVSRETLASKVSTEVVWLTAAPSLISDMWYRRFVEEVTAVAHC